MGAGRPHAIDQFDLVLRLFCLAQLFECIRPHVLRGMATAFATSGTIDALRAFFVVSPPSRWIVYGACLLVVVRGARRGPLTLLAIAHGADLLVSIWTNSLSSGHAEKGLLLLVSVGVAMLAWVDRERTTDRDARAISFLRWTSGIGFAAIAINKTNADFLDPVTSCSRVLSEGLFDRIPFLEAPLAPVMQSPWASLGMEASLLPLLLARPRLGVLYAWGFFTGVAQVGPRATCLAFMALAICFLPRGDIEGIRWRTRLFRHGALVSVVAATIFWTTALAMTREVTPAQLLARVLFLSLALSGIGLAFWNLLFGTGEERGDRSPYRSGPRPAAWIATLMVALMGSNEMAPYLGLKTKYSLTMWSNLRVDPGRWNSHVFPEAVRVLPFADRSLLLVSRLMPAEASAGRGTALPPFVAAHSTALVHLRRLEARHGTLRFSVVLDGDRFAFVGAGPGSPFARFVERTRPAVDLFDQRIMTLGRPQRCLGP